MITDNIVHFLSELKDNNNREWFTENKARYLSTKAAFEQMVSTLLLELSKFDEEIKYVAVKDCVFRIYKDVRFSHDKTPYKTHYGAFIAPGGGRKSVRGGYYFHVEPGNSFIAAGVWSPPTEVLKALRKGVYENIDEFKEIITHADFQQYFGTFYQEGKLKDGTQGISKGFQGNRAIKAQALHGRISFRQQAFSSRRFHYQDSNHL